MGLVTTQEPQWTGVWSHFPPHWSLMKGKQCVYDFIVVDVDKLLRTRSGCCWFDTRCRSRDAIVIQSIGIAIKSSLMLYLSWTKLLVSLTFIATYHLKRLFYSLHYMPTFKLTHCWLYASKQTSVRTNFNGNFVKSWCRSKATCN